MTQDAQDLWMEVRGRLRTFIARRVEADAAVDDLLQEVFLRIHDKIDSLQDPRRLVSWIFQITRHSHYRLLPGPAPAAARAGRACTGSRRLDEAD